MNAHELDGRNVVVNTIVVESLDAKPGLIDADLHGGAIGWSWDGSVMLPPVPTPAPVPEEVQMANARKVLRLAGITDAMIRSAIAASSMTDVEKDLALIDWEFRQTVRRDSPLVATLAPLVGLTTPEQIDALFREAGQ